MKVGILSHYYQSRNYGGMLQAYALATYLRGNGLDAEQICYALTSEPFLNAARPAAPVSKSDPVTRLIRRVRGSLRYRLYEKPRVAYYEDYKRTLIPRRAKSFAAFQALVPHSDAAYTPDTVASAAERCDVLITGSDQVWNFDWFNPAFFLDIPGCRAKRIAYAASAGKSSFNEAEEAYLRRVLPAFQSISVREADLADSLNTILDTDSVVTTVDPTLLLSPAEWQALAGPRLIPKKYLFCYFLHNDKGLSKLARQFARIHHLKIATIPFAGLEYNETDMRFGKYRFDAIGPDGFLSLILHADYVFTDSFHASVFSLLFHKQFVTLPRGDAAGMGSRLKTLTELFGCPERFCSVGPKDRLAYILSLKELDDRAGAPKAQAQIQLSMEFLAQALGKD